MRTSRRAKTLISATKSKSDFGRQVRGAVRGLWSDEIDFFTFVDTILSAVFRAYERAWREGSAICGIRPEDRTVEEQFTLDQQIQIANGAVMGFGDYVYNHRKIDGHLLRSNEYRANLWINRYDAIVTLARATSCADRKFMWILGSTREHCRDCLTYNGRVHRGSVWESVGARPQSHSLECRGFNCLCQLVPTDQPATPGRPPRPSG